MDNHYRTLGILYVVFGSLNVLLLIWGTYIFQLFQHMFPHDQETLMAILAAKVFIASIVITSAALYILTGYGLLKKKGWSMVLALVMGIISLGLFPLGSALGLYSIIVFLMAQSPNYNPDLRKSNEEENDVSNQSTPGSANPDPAG